MLTNKQLLVLERLEKAIKECKESGLHLYGYDTDLYWSLKTEHDTGENFCDWYRYGSRDGLAGRVEDYGCYQGSGGF